MVRRGIRRIFNTAKEAGPPLMTEAKIVGTEQLVSLPAAVLRNGSVWYDEKTHKGKLCCPDCDARVHYYPAVKTKNGSRGGGNQEYFRTNRGQKHAETCEVGARIKEHTANKKEYRGYRLNINSLSGSVVKDITLAEKYNTASSGQYRRSSRITKTSLPKEEMQFLQPYAVDNVRDVTKFLETTDLDSIWKSVVVFRHFELRLRDFLLYYNKSDSEAKRNIKFKNFVSRLIETGQSYQPVLLEIDIEKPYSSAMLKANPGIPSRAIHVPTSTKTGMAHYIKPRVYVDTDNTNVTWGISERGKYLVMGIARITKSPRGDVWLNLSITSPEQIMKGSIAEIWERNKKKHGFESQALSP